MAREAFGGVPLEVYTDSNRVLDIPSGIVVTRARKLLAVSFSLLVKNPHKRL